MSGSLSFIKLLPLEINQVELKDCYPIDTKVKAESEEVLVEEINDDLKKLWALSMQSLRRSLEVQMAMSFEGKTPALKKEFRRLEQRSETLTSIFWTCAKDEYNIHEYPNIGMREPWRLVRIKVDPRLNSLPPFLKQMMKGMPGMETPDDEEEE